MWTISLNASTHTKLTSPPFRAGQRCKDSKVLGNVVFKAVLRIKSVMSSSILVVSDHSSWSYLCIGIIDIIELYIYIYTVSSSYSFVLLANGIIVGNPTIFIRLYIYVQFNYYFYLLLY